MKFFKVVKDLQDVLSATYDSELVAPGAVASERKNLKVMYNPVKVDCPLRLGPSLSYEEVQITLVGKENTKKGWEELMGAGDVLTHFIKNKRWDNLDLTKKNGPLKLSFMGDNVLPAILINLKIYYLK